MLVLPSAYEAIFVVYAEALWLSIGLPRLGSVCMGVNGALVNNALPDWE